MRNLIKSISMLKKIVLKNYRNLKDLDFDFSEKGNICIASNGSGKTNFLESIYFSVFGDSFRSTENGTEYIGPYENFARITTKWESEILDLILTNVNDHLKKKLTLNDKRILTKETKLKFPLILFAPTSVDLISGEPSLRRNDLDNYLSMIDVDYSNYFEKYKVILKNRNALIKNIKDGKSSRTELTYWTEQLLNLSESIYNKRIEFITEIDVFIKDIANKILFLVREENFTNLTLNYINHLNSEKVNYISNLKLKFSENIEKEIIVGKTLYGVHKDDFSVNLNQKNLRYFGSRGQQRIATFLIKIAQINFLKNRQGKLPLFLIDDIMSELDQVNREKVSKYLRDSELQFIMTTAEANEIPELLKEISKLVVLPTIQ